MNMYFIYIVFSHSSFYSYFWVLFCAWLEQFTLKEFQAYPYEKLNERTNSIKSITSQVAESLFLVSLRIFLPIVTNTSLIPIFLS